MPTTNTNNSPAQTPYTAAQLDERTKYRRAVEAVIWGMPLVNTEAMRQAYLRDVGATYNDICYFSQPADWRFQVTTPNASTNYVYFNFNLTQGPVVIEVPEPVGAGLLGGMLDAWDVMIAGVGPADENSGKAAKYLLLPPGFDGETPDGYIVVRFATYNGYALLRAIPVTKSQADVAAALTLVKKIRAYPLAQAENPPQQPVQVKQKRLTLNLPAVMHTSFKGRCVREGVTIQDKVQTLIEDYLAADLAAAGQGAPPL